MQDASFWTLFRQAALRSNCQPSERINLDRPDAGIEAVSAAGDASGFRLLRISPSDDGVWPAKLVETYNRGNDLVATYTGTDNWPFASQIYWTLESADAGGQSVHSLSIVISIQTDRLDTHPQMVVRSSMPADEVLQLSVAGDELLVDSHAAGDLRIDPQADACGLLWRLSGGELSYAEIMPVSDFRQLAVEHADSGISSRWELFAEFLEKGVIRRARLQSLFVPRENDVQLVAEACQSIERRPLPLTT